MCHGQNTWAVEIEVDLTSSVLQQVRPYLIPKKFYTVSTILIIENMYGVLNII